MSHARLSPSAADRWLACPASVNREARHPDSTSEAAEWGTAAHAILERSLLNMVHPTQVDLADLFVDTDDPDWAPAYNINARYGLHDLLEMRDTAAVAYDYVFLQGEILAESQVTPGKVIGREDCWGTADIQVLGPNSLEVVDLKAGKGVIVEPDTAQLKLYALGALYMHPVRLRSDDAQVRLTIVQPRALHARGPIRSIDMTAGELKAWAQEVFAPGAAETDNPDAVAVPTDKGCRFCRAKADCQELAGKATAAAQAFFTPVAVGSQDRSAIAASLTRSPDQLSPEDVAYILDNEALISGWLKAVRDRAYATLKDGGTIPGYKLVNGRGSRSWAEDPAELFKRFKGFTTKKGKKLTKSMLYTESFLSPAQMEKQVKTLVSSDAWEIISGCIVSKPGAPTLAPESDSRPSVSNKAAEMFTPVTDDVPDYMK